MGYITSLFVRKVIQQVDENVDKKSIMMNVGVDPDGPVEPKKMVLDTDYYSFLEDIAAADPHVRTLPLRAGESMRCDDYGIFGLAWKSAVNLRGSYERAERYAKVLTNVSAYQVVEVDHGALMHLHRDGERRLGMRLSNEATIASVTAISRQVSSTPFNPTAVFFKHAAPDDVSDHEAYFGCPVYFDSDKDALLVSRQSLESPNKLGDLTISRFFDSHLEGEVSKLEDKTGLAFQVCAIISRSLSEGVPNISGVARQLAMSGRTLQRKLSRQKYTFQALVDESRRQLGERLVKETEYSFAEIAFMCGFSEQSAFNRAFKRWAGKTPRTYRLNP
ncbi:MAG: AraC family transcriptional regulator [Acidobacteriota bacterium]|nr:AraC family transcriptional regulator [Acidobacteriota bacterium]